MTLLCDRPTTTQTESAGYSLLEVLVSLAILAMVTGVSVAGLRNTSPGIHLQRQAAELQNQASRLRTAAIATQTPTKMDAASFLCGVGAGPVLFFPDGTGISPDLCLSYRGHDLQLRLNPLTGQFKEVQP